jgi:N-acetylmuramoyl-L-alanine amidase
LEKAVTLAAARAIAARLEDRYRVVLTRSDDYRLDLQQRVETANRQRAHLFISLHTGAGFLHQAAGRLIYHYVSHQGSSLAGGSPPSPAEKRGSRALPWGEVQLGHQTASSRFARLLKTFLNQAFQGESCRLQGAPLELLKGAAMPAVLIEMGYLTNPGNEKRLNDSAFMEAFSGAVAAGIDAFLNE